VEFDAALLDAPVVSADPGLKALMDEHAGNLLASYRERMNLANEVRERIARTLPNGEPALATVAAELGLTGRVLQNRLKEAGSHFTELVDEVRAQLARDYLSDSKYTLIDVAFLLGFSEQSSFSRAFRRWTGQAPVDYRKNQTET
jgi:AraC-like DNA-binding protein